jgi:hypothetical protein
MGASQRITCLGEDISPPITRIPQELKRLLTEARSAPAVGTVAERKMRVMSKLDPTQTIDLRSGAVRRDGI